MIGDVESTSCDLCKKENISKGSLSWTRRYSEMELPKKYKHLIDDRLGSYFICRNCQLVLKC